MRNSKIILLVLLSFSCSKEDINSNNVLFNFSISNKDGLVADGQSTVLVSAELDKKTDPAKRNIIFKTTSGAFTGNNDTQFTVKADFLQGKLVAQTTLRLPISPGRIFLSATPETKSSYVDIISKDSFDISPSIPSTLTLEPSSVAVQKDYQSEIQIVGTLKNKDGKNVSLGTKVKFEDFDMSDKRLSGSFRATQNASDASSKVSTFYSPGYLTAGSKFYILCSVFDGSGNVLFNNKVYITVIE